MRDDVSSGGQEVQEQDPTSRLATTTTTKRDGIRSNSFLDALIERWTKKVEGLLVGVGEKRSVNPCE